MMRVFTLGRSMPVSMMVVHTRMSRVPSAIWLMMSPSCSWSILPWAVAMRTEGSSRDWILAAVRSMVSVRLWR